MSNARILILANNSGGLYRFRKELIAKLVNEKYEVIVSTPFDDNVEDIFNLGVQLIETPINRRGMNPITDFKLLIKYFNIVRNIRPDLIITYTIKPNLYGGIIARFLKVDLAINITGLGTAFQKEGVLKKVIIKWYKFVCKKAQVVFFENSGNKDIFVNAKIINEDRCVVLNGAGVNLNDFPFRDYPPIEDKIHFLFIGRIMKEKGIDELFEGVEKYSLENDNIVLDILGHYEEDYQEKISRLVDKGIVNYYGYQEDVKPFIEQCHCFVLPSYHEGMANTLLECASMGRPLITSDIHGCKEAIFNNGFLCNVGDSNDLYQKLKQFIDLDYTEKQELAYNSRKHIEKIFDKEKVVNETIKGLNI